MRFLGVRLRETLGFEVIVSVLCSMLFYFGILRQTLQNCFVIMLLCIAANIVYLVISLRGYYLFSGTTTTAYYKTNIAVVFIITILTLVFAGFNIDPLFTWLFFPFKFLYLCFGIPKIVSALALNAVFAVITVSIPVFIKLPYPEMWDDEDELQDNEDEL